MFLTIKTYCFTKRRVTKVQFPCAVYLLGTGTGEAYFFAVINEKIKLGGYRPSFELFVDHHFLLWWLFFLRERLRLCLLLLVFTAGYKDPKTHGSGSPALILIIIILSNS